MRQRVDVEKLGTSPNHTQADWTRFSEWLARIAHRNAIDPAVMNYPATFVLKSHRGDKATLYMPVQPCYVYESLAISPENSAADTAESLKAMFAVLHYESVSKGQGESYFLCSDMETCKFAEHQGLDKVTASESLERFIRAAEAVIGSGGVDPAAVGELDDALNAYKRNPGLQLYRTRHIQAAEIPVQAEQKQIEAVTV